MSDTTNNDLNFDDDPNGPEDHRIGMTRKDIRALEASAKRGRDADEANERAEKAERALVFAQAGIDTTSDVGATFMRGYDGELDKDKVREAATAFNLVPADRDTTGHTVHDDTGSGDTPLLEGEDGMTGHRATVASGAPPDQGVEVNPYEEAVRLGERALADGAKREEAWGIGFAHLVAAAQDGDQRVIIPGRSVAAQGEG